MADDKIISSPKPQGPDAIVQIDLFRQPDGLGSRLRLAIPGDVTWRELRQVLVEQLREVDRRIVRESGGNRRQRRATAAEARRG